MLCRCEPGLIHLPASIDGTCRLWDLHLTEEEQQEDTVRGVKFSEDCTLLAVSWSANLELWKTSTWVRLWSVPCEATDADDIDFSRDGLRVFVMGITYDVLSGDRLNQIDFMPMSMHDHVHEGEIWNKLECKQCMRSFSKKGEYWFTRSGRWLWIVEEHGAKRLIHIPAEYGHIRGIKGCQCYIAFMCDGKLLVLDTCRV